MLALVTARGLDKLIEDTILDDPLHLLVGKTQCIRLMDLHSKQVFLNNKQ